MIFPQNNLPTQSKYWGREVEKRLTNLENSLQSSEINNVTRDSQLNVTANSALTAATTADGAASDVADIINNIYTAGTTNIDGTKLADGTIGIGKLVAGTITGDVINGGTITGVTIQSAASGQRVVISSDEIDLYNSSNELTGNINGSFYSSSKALAISSSDGFVTITNGSAPVIWGGSADSSKFTALVGDTQVSQGKFTVGDGLTTLTGGLSVSNGATIAGGLNVGAISATGSSTFSSTLLNTGAPTTSNDANVYLTTGGRFEKSTAASTIEVKENIRPLEFSSEDFININPVIFDYKDGIVSDDSGKNVIGFIAEDFEDAGLAAELVSPAESEADFKSLRYNKLYMFLHKVVQEQQATISSLEARIQALESR